jgi:hypothetical protein
VNLLSLRCCESISSPSIPHAMCEYDDISIAEFPVASRGHPRMHPLGLGPLRDLCIATNLLDFPLELCIFNNIPCRQEGGRWGERPLYVERLTSSSLESSTRLLMMYLSWLCPNALMWMSMDGESLALMPSGWPTRGASESSSHAQPGSRIYRRRMDLNLSLWTCLTAFYH